MAYVSTNSIVQGEQVGILWNVLINKYHIKIHFAHQTFNWSNEARSNAAVHVVIIGFAQFNSSKKAIYHYQNISGNPQCQLVSNINPYLLKGQDLIIIKRKKPICDVQEMNYGSMPNDGGHLLLDENEKIDLLKVNPDAKPFIKKFVMG